MPFHPRVWPWPTRTPTPDPSSCMKTPSDDGARTQGEGSGLLEGLGAFGPQLLQHPIPPVRRILLGGVSLTAERPTGLLTCTAPAVRRRCRCREG